MPDQNIVITQERYKSNAYVWRIVRLGFTFLTAKNILLNARLISDGRQNPNNDPLFFKALVILSYQRLTSNLNISLVFVSLSSCEPNKKLLDSILVLVRPLKPLMYVFRPLLGLILALLGLKISYGGFHLTISHSIACSSSVQFSVSCFWVDTGSSLSSLF